MAGVSAKDKAPVEGMQKIDLTTLSIPQLAQLKQNLEQVSEHTPVYYHCFRCANFNIVIYCACRISSCTKILYRLLRLLRQSSRNLLRVQKSLKLLKKAQRYLCLWQDQYVSIISFVSKNSSFLYLLYCHRCMCQERLQNQNFHWLTLERVITLRMWVAFCLISYFLCLQPADQIFNFFRPLNKQKTISRGKLSLSLNKWRKYKWLASRKAKLEMVRIHS